MKVTIFFDVTLKSHYHGCRGEAINLISHYLTDIINKIASHLEKLQII